MSSKRGEPLQTFILLPLSKFKHQEERVKKADAILTSHDSPLPQASPAPPTPPPAASPQEEPEPPVSEEEAPPAPAEPSRTPSRTNQSQAFREKQIKKVLSHIAKVYGSDSILQLDNIDALIANALSQSKKSLANQEEFYNFLFSNNLASLVRNRHAIARYYKNHWFFI